MEIRTARISVTTTGSAGAATGSATTEVLHGFLLDVYLDYHASAPATTDVVIAHSNPTLGAVLTVANTKTDGRYVPRETVQTIAGAISDPDGYDRIALAGTLTVTVAESNALAPAVTVTIRYLGL